DQDETAGGAVPGVGVAEDRLGEPEPDPADLVQPEFGRRLVPVQGVDVDPVVQVGDDRLDRAGGVLDDQPAAPGQLRVRRHPADHRLDVLGDGGPVVRPADHVAAGDV